MLDKNMTEYTNHPAAELFPMMEQSELEKLAQDIKENGLLDPVILYHGQVLDGRNRLAACKLSGVQPRYSHLNGDIPSATLFVISKNLHRRHLTTSQRAAIGAEITPLLEEESNKRKLASLKQNQPLTPLPSNDGNGRNPHHLGESVALAADAVKVGSATVQRALKVMREDPPTFEKIKAGEITANAAFDAHMGRSASTKPVNIQYVPDTPAKKSKAESQKRKLGDGVAMLEGLCEGLKSLDMVIAVSVCSDEEVETWAKQSEQYGRELKRFASRLRGAKNG